MLLNAKLQSRFKGLKTTGLLPSPKGVALVVMRLTQQEDATSAQLARAVEADPALVAWLIKLANRCQLPGSGPILTIKDAVNLLGCHAVRGLALGLSLMADRQNGRCQGFDYAGFWSRSLACAVTMRAFSARASVIQGDEAFTLGLLAHTGQLGLAGLFPDAYAPLLKSASRGALLAQERQAFEFDHADLTVALLLDWGFPQALVAPILQYEQETRPDSADSSCSARLTLALLLAGKMADICMAEKDIRHTLMAPLLELGNKLGISTPELPDLCDEVVQDWLEWSQLLNVAPQRLPPFAELLQRAAAAPWVADLPAPADQNRCSVLAVMADAAVRARLANALRQAGYPCGEAASAGQALTQVRRQPPDLMLIDRQLPGMNGLELIQVLRQEPAGATLWMVLLTQPGQDTQAPEAFAAGADDCLPGTAAPGELLVRLMAWQRVVNLHRRIQRDQSNLQHFSAEFAKLNQRMEETRQTGLENQQRLELALSGSDLGCWDWDIASGQVVLNERWCSMLGYRFQEIVPTLATWRQLSHPDDVGRVERAMKRHLSSKTPVYESEHRLRHKDGHWIWVLDRGRVVARDSAGVALRVVGTHMDITARILAQQELQCNHILLQSILENIPVGLSAFDANLTLIAKNELFQRNLDLPDALFAEGVTSFEHIIRFNAARGEYGACDPDAMVAKLVEQARHTVAHQFERVRANGTVLEIRGAPMPGGGFVTIYADISERKRAAAQVQHSTQLLRGAIDSIDEAFALFDPQDQLVFCNEKYPKLYALSADLIKPGASFEHILREGVRRGQYPDAIGREEQWVVNRLAAHRAANASVVQRLDDGRVLRIIERKLPDGSTVGFRIDITDLVRATEEAQAANLAKSRFLATMSHEIRTPMNGILGMAQLLMRPELGERDRLEYARTVLNSGRSLLTLLNDILDLSKIEAGRFQLDLTGINPVQLLQETRTLFSGAAKNKGLRLDCQCHPDLAPMYQTDGHRLRQMLANLVGNAIKFTLSGHVLIEAQELQRDDTSALLEFSVTDSGIGIAADKQASLFEAFSQIDSSTTREFGGSGLGLSIVSQLARLLGGDVGVQSEPGKGSRFWFRVRAGLRQADASSQLLSAPLHQTGKIASPQLKGLVLVAEDNAVNCMVIEGLLQTLGLTVQLVDNGQQAVDRLLQGPPPDVVLMDLHMPVMDGYTATERIRQTERDKLRPRVPILALTADAFENDHQHCLAVGMDGFLTKPVTLEDLRAALARCLPGVVPDAAEASSPGPVPEPDWPHLQKLLDETQELLSRQKFDAIESFAALQSAAGATTLGSHLNEVAPLITSLRFEEALARLRQLRALC